MGEIGSILHCDVSTPLAANELFTSEWQKVRFEPYSAEPAAQFIRLRGVVSTDENSFTPHFWVEFSEDALTVSLSPGSVAIIGDVPIAVDVLCLGQYVRVNLQNGATAQGVLLIRLYLEEMEA